MSKNQVDKRLTPAFREGEHVEIHRTLPSGERVIILATADAASSMEPHRMVLSARVHRVGVSGYADGRVARQAESINRLLRHLQEHCADVNCPHRTQESTEPGPVTVLGEGVIASTSAPEEDTVINWRGMNFVMQREGTDNGTNNEDGDAPASPVHGSGHQA